MADGWRKIDRGLFESPDGHWRISNPHRLETDLRPWLRQSAPPINLGPPPYKSGVSLDGQLWYAFAKLDDALADLEVHRIRAMPPHEREARFHSARLAATLPAPTPCALPSLSRLP